MGGLTLIPLRGQIDVKLWGLLTLLGRMLPKTLTR